MQWWQGPIRAQNGIRNFWIQVCWMQKYFLWRRVCDKTHSSKHRNILSSQLWRMDKGKIKGIRPVLDIARSTWISTIGHIGMEIKIFKLFGKRKITQNKVTNGSIFSRQKNCNSSKCWYLVFLISWPTSIGSLNICV